MGQSTKPFQLETLERKKVEKFRREKKDVRIHKRLSALLWLNKGYAVEEVADLLEVCTRTINNWVDLYHQQGLEALCSLEYKGDPGWLSAAQLDQLKQEVATGRFKCATQVCDWVEQTFGRRFSPSGMRKVLVWLGCSFHKVSGFLFKADQEKQKEFIADYEQDKKKVQTESWRRYFIDGVGCVLPLSQSGSEAGGSMRPVSAVWRRDEGDQASVPLAR
jgi:transposase